jgi:mannose-6-phosphate isomerase-like protein (cupin superfamily)
MQATYSIVQVGSPQQWDGFVFDVPPLPMRSKRFLKRELDLTGMEVSVNSLLPGQDMPFLHRHEDNEEVYLFLSGEGEFQADGQMIPIVPGTCVRCAPSVARSWRNNGTTPMAFVVIQARAGSYGDAESVADGRPAEGLPKWML